MGILEEINRMKNQGLSKDQMITELQEQGISPKAINDAFDQTKIKEAISNPPVQGESSINNSQQPPAPQAQPQTYAQTQEAKQTYYNPPQEPQQQEQYSSSSAPEPYPPQPEQEPPQEDYYAPEQGYYAPEDQGYDYGENSGLDTDTIIEIAGQVFSEKIKKIENQVSDFNEFKTLSETKIQIISERLKRIENTIDKLQSSILEKIGSYGSGLESIKKEMNMIENSLSKSSLKKKIKKD